MRLQFRQRQELARWADGAALVRGWDERGRQAVLQGQRVHAPHGAAHLAGTACRRRAGRPGRMGPASLSREPTGGQDGSDRQRAGWLGSPRTWARPRLHLRRWGQGVAVLAGQALVELAAAALVNVYDRRAAGRGPLVTPCGERDDHGLEAESFRGEDVLAQVGVVGVAPGLHEAGLHEVLQAAGEHVGCDAEVALEVGEPGGLAEDRVADDQQAPALADGLQGTRRRAVLPVVGPAEHPLPPLHLLASCYWKGTSMMQADGG